MRVAVGLVGLLVAIMVVVLIMRHAYLPSLQQAASVQKNVKPKVEQISGHTTDGEDARTTISLDAESSGGRMQSVVVTSIKPGGAMEKYFGLQRGDSIIAIASQGGVETPVKEMNDPAAAKDELLRSYENSQHIIVMRGDQKITLPGAAGTANANPSAPAAATPASGGDTSSSLEKQLQGIKVPTH